MNNKKAKGKPPMTGKKNKDNFNDNSRPPRGHPNRKAIESYILAFVFMASSVLAGHQTMNAHESLNDLRDNQNEHITEIKEQFRSSCMLETGNINIESLSPKDQAERCMTEKAEAQLGEEYKKIQEKKEKWFISAVLLPTFSIALLAAGRHYARQGRKNNAGPKL